MHRPIWRVVAISAALAAFVLPSTAAVAAPPPSAPASSSEQAPAVEGGTSAARQEVCRRRRPRTACSRGGRPVRGGHLLSSCRSHPAGFSSA